MRLKDAGDVATYRQSDTSPVLERLWLDKISKASLLQTVRKTEGFFSSSTCKHGEGRPSSHPATSAFSPHAARSSNTFTTGRSVRQRVIALVYVRPTSPSRRSLSKIEAHPQFVGRSAVAHIPVRPTPPKSAELAHRRSVCAPRCVPGENSP